MSERSPLSEVIEECRRNGDSQEPMLAAIFDDAAYYLQALTQEPLIDIHEGHGDEDCPCFKPSHKKLEARIKELEDRLANRTALKLGFCDENNVLTEKGWEHFRKQTAGTGMVLLSKEEAERVEELRGALQPFAAFAERYESDAVGSLWIEVLHSDLRQARLALLDERLSQ
jgi:hypothetical protein